MNVGQLKKELAKYADNMELEYEPHIEITEEYQHPERGWEELAFQDGDIEALVRKDFPTRTILSIYSGDGG